MTWRHIRVKPRSITWVTWSGIMESSLGCAADVRCFGQNTRWWRHGGGLWLRDGGTYAAVNWVIIGSGNGLVPNRHQAIIWTNADLTPLEYSSGKMSVYCGSFWTSFNEWNSLFMLVVKYDLVLRTHLVATEMIIIWCFHLNILIFAPNEIFISTVLPLSRWAIMYGDTNTRARYFWITPGYDSEVRHVHMAEDWYILLTATVTQLTIIINLYFGLSARYHTPVGFVWASIH